MNDLLSYVKNELNEYLNRNENLKEETVFLFNRTLIFMKEHIMINDNLFPLKNSFLENEKSTLSLFLCNNTEIKFEIEENVNNSL